MAFQASQRAAYARRVSASPIFRISESWPLNANADVRDATRSPSSLARALMISSVMPSAKYSLSLSALMFANGSTAMEACTGPLTA